MRGSGYTIAYVWDVGETVEFWEQAFSLKRRFVDENNEYLRRPGQRLWRLFLLLPSQLVSNPGRPISSL